MNVHLEKLIGYMINRHIIGNKHAPERLLIVSRTKHVSKEDRKAFTREYEEFIRDGYIFRIKKRTGKGSEWHISLNPHKMIQ